jgi:SAM-dependent methyltransferase
VDATGWDRRYDASDLVWSATPNAVVAREAADLPPGRALDLASGEGRNAIWLAERGWRVTAVDFSAVATARARRLAQERLGAAATRVEAVTADLMTWSPPPAGADLAVLAYLQLSVGERRHVHRLAAAALASGGTFLLVAHHRDNLTEGVGGPQDPAVLFTPDEVERVVAAEGVDAHQADAPAHAVALDVLVRAHRASR